jgi:Family of unknown function (DUF5709)
MARMGYPHHMSSSFSDDQLQPDDTLDERGVDDVLDEGMSPPERPSRAVAHGVTSAEDAEGETLDERLEQEEPDPVAAVDHTPEAQEDEALGEEGTDPTDGFEVGDERTGRLAAGEGESAADTAEDVGVDGAAAGAEEAAVHTVDEDQV